ncbi:DUF1285 domain-containing protein [Paracoccus zhejiangensis]|uniref:DUF1285 domain-containing protein n=1 Tax=Paracoccus zhejiangensis TaxID=1077935 RepID=A0A2H5EWH2_9RHOB|nr:DUF1285 domain-containing protein [Paracoccus zhejiangensis]AUH63658.1 DUF1285 domain-containing protein [Paracoccus zhejiangensis]
MADETDNRVSASPTPGAPTADGIAAAASKAGKKGLPPVHLWNPPFCGDLDMRIKADGTWFYQGTPIGRPAMVRLFSTVLKREGDKFFLVTPVEKVGIVVDDAPFIAIDAEIQPDRITFTTNVGDEVVADAENPIILRGDAQEPRPYVHVRRGLEALIDRKTFYRLAAAADEGPEGKVGVRSSGQFFPLEF